MISIIEPKQLFPLSQDSLILDASNPEIYAAGHIQDSHCVPPQSLYSYIENTPPFLPNTSTITHILETLGYKTNMPIIVLDSEGGGWAGRLLWTLTLVQIPNLSYLNGGQIAWRSQGLQLTQELPSAQPIKIDTITTNLSALATKKNILHSLECNDSIFWDARSAREFQGHQSGSARSGCIPGAIHCEWTELMDQHGHIIDHTQKYLETKGIDGGKPIITYCQSNHRSGLTWLVGALLGWDIKAYSGGWNEWGNDNSTPIE